GIRDLRNLNHRNSRFITWKKTTLSLLENIFSEGSEYVRRFEKLTFQEPGFGVTRGSGTSYEDMGSFVHDLDRAKTILEDGIEALRRLRPPKPKAPATPKEAPVEESLPNEPESDDLFFERAILEKTLSEGPVAETVPEEDLTTAEEVLTTSFEEGGTSLEEVIKSSREEGEPFLRSQSVEEVAEYVSSLLYHYISLEEDPQTRKALQGLRAELENPKRSKEGIMKALKASWQEGKDVLVDIIARVFAKKQ
ncbi:MAG: hypothetical protein GTO13_19130, partial [Proteobacteria bacterium]|nr:hypothetical protein [Pseudomonadota bacterium]